MSKNILIIIGLFILSACSNNLTDKFSSDFIDETEVCFTPSELIKSDILCRYPIRLEILDSVFVVQDLGGSEYLQVYDRFGEYIDCLAKKGDAPMEIPNLTDLFTITSDRKIRAGAPRVWGLLNRERRDRNCPTPPLRRFVFLKRRRRARG